MTFLVDTNVLIPFADRSDPRQSLARNAIASIRRRAALRAASQNLIELWNVLTRPVDRNGFGRTPSAAAPLLKMTEDLFPRLHDPTDTYERWRDLVVRFGVSGVQVHDARLVAVMIGSGIEDILTFNTIDFRRYSALGIQAVDPSDV